MRRVSAIGAVLNNDHVVYQSGRHGSQYFNKDAIYPHTTVIAVLCEDIALHFLRGPVIDIVVGPEKGGIILAQWTAHALTRNTAVHTRPKVLAVYAEKVMKEGELIGFEFKRGYEKLLPGKNVLVTEDVLTSGDTAQKTIRAVREFGGNVVGLGVLNNREGRPATEFGVPKLYSVFDLRMESYAPDECPLCKANVPINTSVGHGKKFLDEKQAAASAA